MGYQQGLIIGRQQQGSAKAESTEISELLEINKEAEENANEEMANSLSSLAQKSLAEKAAAGEEDDEGYEEDVDGMSNEEKTAKVRRMSALLADAVETAEEDQVDADYDASVRQIMSTKRRKNLEAAMNTMSAKDASALGTWLKNLYNTANQRNQKLEGMPNLN
jgi:hypothetical protein